MMTVTEKAAYLKGLAEGLSLDPDKNETKLINAMIDVIDEMALSIADLEDSLDMVVEQLDAVDEDLSEVEDYLFEEDDDECAGCCGSGDYFEVECPACGETFSCVCDDDCDCCDDDDCGCEH